MENKEKSILIKMLPDGVRYTMIPTNMTPYECIGVLETMKELVIDNMIRGGTMEPINKGVNNETE